MPSPGKILRYHTPVSRPVRSDELHFECSNGRISYIDVRAFTDEINDNIKQTIKKLETAWKIEETTSQIGAFRLRYVVERQRDFADRIVEAPTPSRRSRNNGDRFSWTVEPVQENRGETIDVALDPRSTFRQLIDGVDAQQTVVTLWVYPDSFAMFRRLRDFLHERDIEVAGRPIPTGARIGASPDGTASRGQ